MNKIFSCLFLFQILAAASFSQMNQQWASQYNGPRGFDDVASAMVVDDAGNVYVTGSSYDSVAGYSHHIDFATVKYNSAGVQQWSAIYSGRPDTNNIAYCIAVDAGGNVYVSGECGGTLSVMITIKYNSSGVLQWAQVWSGLGLATRPYAMVVDALGNVFVTGRGVIAANHDDDFITIKYNTNGVQQWMAAYNYQNLGSDAGTGIAVDNIGNVYVVGTSYDSTSGGHYFIATIKYDSFGSAQWIQRHAGAVYLYGPVITTDNLGDVFVTGGTYNNESYTVKYNSSGVQQWAVAGGNSIVVDRTGNLYVVGGSTIKKFDPSGDSLWSRTFTNYSTLSKAAFDNCLGYVYISAEYFDINSNYDYLTLRYNSYGDSLWSGKYNGPSNNSDRPKAITTDGLGNVYVTGNSTDPAHYYTKDYTTVKYAPSTFFIHTAKKTNVGKAINDNQTTSDSIFIDCSLMNYTTADVNVKLNNITHTRDSDLEILLIHNSATDNTVTTDTLVYQAGGTGQNFTGTILNDSASAPISSGTAPFTGSYKPQKPLSQFNGQGISGVWILKIYDRATGNTGILNSWSIDFLLSNNPIGIQNISNEIPNRFSLSQNYPNPFNPTTNIKFAIPNSGFVKLIVYDITGREVETLVNENLNAGTYNSDWNAVKYSSGVYFYKLSSQNFNDIKKMILVK